MAQAGDALEEDIATFAIGPDGEQVSIAPGSTMAPASGHARVFTSIPDEANPAKMMLTFKDYPVTPGFTYRQLRMLVAEDFDNFFLSIHLTDDEGNAYDPDSEVTYDTMICTNGSLPLDDFHMSLWNVLEMLLGAFAAVPSQILELPLDTILFHRLHVLFSAGKGATAPTILQTVVRMYREQGIGAFFHGGFYLAIAAFTRDALSRSRWTMTVSPYVALPLLTTASAMFTFPVLYLIARGLPGASFADSFFACPSLSLVARMLQRIPSVTPLFLLRDVLNLLVPSLANLLRLPLADSSFATHMLRTVAVHPVKLAEKRVMLSRDPISPIHAVAELLTYRSWVFFDAIAVNIALRGILFTVQPLCRTALNRHMSQLTKSMDDQSAVRRLAYESVLVGLLVPGAIWATYMYWGRGRSPTE